MNGHKLRTTLHELYKYTSDNNDKKKKEKKNTKHVAFIPLGRIAYVRLIYACIRQCYTIQNWSF